MKSEKKTLVQTLALGYVPAMAVLAAVAWGSRAFEVNAGLLTRDPVNILKYPWWYGTVSHIGILLWCATASVCMLSVAVMRRDRELLGVRSFLLASGLLSAWLLFDDLWLFHEVVAPKVLDIPQRYVYTAYALAVLSLLAAFRVTIYKTQYGILLVAGGFLGLSLVVHTYTNRMEDTSLKFLLEDGTKFLGIVGWFTYFAQLCVSRLRGPLAP